MTLKSKFYFGALIVLGSAGLLVLLVKIASATVQISAGAEESKRTIQSMPSTNIRLSRPVDPFWSGRPMISGAIRPHAASLKTKRSTTPKTASPKAVLNHASSQMGIPRVHTT